MEKIPSKMVRKFQFQFYTQKNCQKCPFLGCLKWPHLGNPLSVKAEILHGILKKIVFGLDGKNSFKNGQEVEFQFYIKNGKKCPILGCLKQLHLENRLSVNADILSGILKKIVLDLMEKVPLEML
jgi:hypothetical protein